MDFLFYYRGITMQTGKQLAEDLHIESGGDPPPDRIRVLVRWGNGYGIGYIPQKVLNKQTALHKAINKFESMRIFTRARLSIPILSEEVPCIGRTAQHTQGQGLWFCWRPEQIREVKEEGADYFIKYIPTHQEYRVHVVNNKVEFFQRKYSRVRRTSAFGGVQGFTDDWHKQVIDPEEAPANVREQARKAVKALGLDFGGVDIVEDMEGKAYILEVNTGPALPTVETRRPYVKFIQETIEEIEG
jgi:hypothetical protein